MHIPRAVHGHARGPPRGFGGIRAVEAALIRYISQGPSLATEEHVHASYMPFNCHVSCVRSRGFGRKAGGTNVWEGVDMVYGSPAPVGVTISAPTEPFSLEWDTPKVRWTRLHSRDPQDRFPHGPVSGLCAPDQAEHRTVTELSGGMGPSNRARTGGTLVGQPDAEGIGPLGRKHLRPSGVLARVNGGEEYRP